MTRLRVVRRAASSSSDPFDAHVLPARGTLGVLRPELGAPDDQVAEHALVVAADADRHELDAGLDRGRAAAGPRGTGCGGSPWSGRRRSCGPRGGRRAGPPPAPGSCPWSGSSPSPSRSPARGERRCRSHRVRRTAASRRELVSPSQRALGERRTTRRREHDRHDEQHRRTDALCSAWPSHVPPRQCPTVAAPWLTSTSAGRPRAVSRRRSDGTRHRRMRRLSSHRTARCDAVSGHRSGRVGSRY